jgi:hypothetical protein
MTLTDKEKMKESLELIEDFEETPTYGYIKDGVDLITSVSETKILIEVIKKNLRLLIKVILARN